MDGRCPKFTAQQEQAIIQMVSREQKSKVEAAQLFKVHPSTVSRLLASIVMQRMLRVCAHIESYNCFFQLSSLLLWEQ